jgi:GNAT superfamily N-acetyltransferase
MQIVKAKPDDAATLTDIALAAKRHWGYPETWIQNWRTSLSIEPEFISRHEIYKAVVNGRIVGFYALCPESDRLHLNHLWVLPEVMRQGIGRFLFTHAIECMKAIGFYLLEIESDPNAENFYQRTGARRVKVNTTEMDGQIRELPVLVYEVGHVL